MDWTEIGIFSAALIGWTYFLTWRLRKLHNRVSIELLQSLKEVFPEEIGSLESKILRYTKEREREVQI